MEGFLALIFVVWCIWNMYKTFNKNINRGLSNDWNKLNQEDEKEYLREEISRRKSERVSSFKQSLKGSCICGCNGIPMTLLPSYSIDYEKYKYCPARLQRKKTGFYINNSGKLVEWIPSRKKLSLERRYKKIKQKEQKELRDNIRKEKEKETQRRLKEQQIAEWIAQGNTGLKPLSIEEARYRKMKTYIGKPCRLGHIERFTRNSDCVICAMTASKLRDAMKRGAYPIKLNEDEKEQVIRIYEEAKRLSKETGIEHHVDHIKPVSKGGTNHPSNLQILTAKENLSKGDKWQDKN
ncbi:HNH endonuclease signature motif containing protein [Prochlorococcus sp. MIT 0604]|uniref:HNH endonuclease signature motif containing protein n=1 Tax=Prochlorococcus sp. MIT 0604 TaxID=1501268 RepID=UPI0004F76D9B|nr:HNH endonuclease signature motif containing protein [Prochlorococcus sp. MIT 0604]AIQ95771.1 hypothetical protein EW14_1762 [Prochlorococcus sp. MIT 0604]